MDIGQSPAPEPHSCRCPFGSDICKRARCKMIRMSEPGHWNEGHDRYPVAQADFLFLSSSTSVNSASTTSSFAPDLAASPSACCLYIASPSFIETWASVLDLALIAS